MKAISKTAVNMLTDMSRQRDVVQGYAYYVKNFNYGCQYVAERLLDTVSLTFDLHKFKFEMIKSYICWLEERQLENNEMNARQFANDFRAEVSKRMYEKFKDHE